MSKSARLFQNEWFKMTHRTVHKVFFALIPVLMILWLAGNYFLEYRDRLSSLDTTPVVQDQIESLDKEIQTAGSDGERQSLEATRSVIQSMAETGIFERTDSLAAYVQENLAIYGGKELIPLLKESPKAFLEAYRDFLAKQDFATESETLARDARVETIDLLLRDAGDDFTLSPSLYQTMTRREQDWLSLRQGYLVTDMDAEGLTANTVLTDEAREAVERDLRVAESTIENHLSPTPREELARGAAESVQNVGLAVLLVYLIVLAGSNLPSEYSTGTIKSLLMAPVKRKRIFAAKWWTLVAMALAGTLLVVVIAYLASGALFGFTTVAHVDTFFGHVYWIPLPLYLLLFSIAKMIGGLCVCLFTLMVATLTRHAAVSSILGFLAWMGESLSLFVYYLIPGNAWLSLLPYTHMDVETRLFDTGLSAANLSSYPFYDIGLRPSDLHTFLYLVLVGIAFYWIARDRFVRQDI